VTAVRGYRDGDLPRLREICVRTGDAGDDATGRHVSDDLLPDVYLSPYVVHDPGWCWVVADDDDRPVGYLVAAPDTRAFVQWWRESWAPGFARRWAEEADGPDADLVDRGLHPERMIPSGVVDAYPAHLHVDLLADVRGGGVGRRLIETLFDRLRARGVPGVHLGVDPRNTNARAFYDRLGFRAASPDDGVLTRPTAAGPGR
jgi:ribosomal protein S18 acetylase RimI-like enzyme